jgi:hypothetical protein
MCWNHEPSGDYAADCKRGREIAVDLMRKMYFENAPLLLGNTAKAITERGRFDGLEIGFFQAIAEAVGQDPNINHIGRKPDISH